MMKPEFYKPFNMDHAIAGAPFCGANGEAVRVLIWDRKYPGFPIVAIEEDGDQEAVAFRADGTSLGSVHGVVDTLVMLPLGLIDGKPVFVGDELAVKGSETAYTASSRDFKALHNLAWPAPEKVYPETQLRFGDLADAAIKAEHKTMVVTYPQMQAVANAALRHAIDAGQVIIAPKDDPADKGTLCNDQAEVAYWNFNARKKGYSEWKGRPQSERDAFKAEYRNAVAGRAERDMIVARAIRDVCMAKVGLYGVGIARGLLDIDLESIIQSVQ